jgi:hypothetical protein
MKQLRFWSREEGREEKLRWERLPEKSRHEIVAQFVRLIAESVIGTSRWAQNQEKEKR